MNRRGKIYKVLIWVTFLVCLCPTANAQVVRIVKGASKVVKETPSIKKVKVAAVPPVVTQQKTKLSTTTVTGNQPPKVQMGENNQFILDRPLITRTRPSSRDYKEDNLLQKEKDIQVNEEATNSEFENVEQEDSESDHWWNSIYDLIKTTIPNVYLEPETNTYSLLIIYDYGDYGSQYQYEDAA